MLGEYIQKAMKQAHYEVMEDGRYFATIPFFKGLWADGYTEEECAAKLRQVLEEWLVLALREDEDLPEIDGVSLNFGGKRWQRPLPVES